MSEYQHILVALDLSDGSRTVIEQAQSLAALHGARISLVHVVEYVPVEPMGEALLPSVHIEEELLTNARRQLKELAEELGLGDTDRHVEIGNIKAEVLRLAQDLKVDLIALGARERHGLEILLNLTEDTVLHAAPCDVLAVRIRE